MSWITFQLFRIQPNGGLIFLRQLLKLKIGKSTMYWELVIQSVNDTDQDNIMFVRLLWVILIQTIWDKEDKANSSKGRMVLKIHSNGDIFITLIYILTVLDAKVSMDTFSTPNIQKLWIQRIIVLILKKWLILTSKLHFQFLIFLCGSGSYCHMNPCIRSYHTGLMNGLISVYICE